MCGTEMAEKQIKDIRYFESNSANITGNSLPTHIGEIFELPKAYPAVGQKFALMLRERGFTLSDYDHLYIDLSTYLAPGECVMSDRITEKWLRYADYGLDPEVVNNLSDDDKLKLLNEITKEVLLNFCAKNDEDREMIETISDIIGHGGDAIDIVYQEKNDKAVNVKVILNILHDGQCRLFVVIEDLEGQQLLREQIALAEDLSEAMQYAGTILIRKNRVVIKPRNNVFTKDLHPTELTF